VEMRDCLQSWVRWEPVMGGVEGVGVGIVCVAGGPDG
jgi:hypothetical protein